MSICTNTANASNTPFNTPFGGGNTIMRLYKNRKISIGSISTGTMRTEDLIPVFLDTLAYYAPRNAEYIIRKYEIPYTKHSTNEELAAWCDTDTAAYVLNEVLFYELDYIAQSLPFTWFGTHPGDNSDYGFWRMDIYELIQDGDLLRFDDATRNPTRAELQDYTHYARVNDHGNITIYNRVHRFVCAIV